jgi:uncharacterized protein (TIGR00661 family)
MPSLNVAFVVQGEGRGHMTQALALAAFLEDAGHEITNVMVGKSPWRSVPDYFLTGIGADVEEFDAPTQVPDRSGRGVSLHRTAVDVARRSPTFMRSMARIAEVTGEADIVVNFLDLMAGLAGTFRPNDVPTLAVAHNYVFLHPAMSDAPGPHHVRRSVLAYARATAASAHRMMALSFGQLPSSPGIRLGVAPPLLRPMWQTLEPEAGDYLLAYALNAGYGAELVSWSNANPDVRVHCYVDGGAHALPAGTPESFEAHDLDERGFLQHLAGCRAYVGSAGFESICEAFALGKPVLAVPTEGQFEQTLNAWDAERHGAARAGSYDDLDDFWKTPGVPDPGATTRFREWLARAPEILVDAVERTAHTVRGE